MTKTRHDNNVTDYILMVYTKTKTELSRPILSNVVCDENKIGTLWTFKVGNGRKRKPYYWNRSYVMKPSLDGAVLESDTITF